MSENPRITLYTLQNNKVVAIRKRMPENAKLPIGFYKTKEAAEKYLAKAKTVVKPKAGSSSKSKAKALPKYSVACTDQTLFICETATGKTHLIRSDSDDYAGLKKAVLSRMDPVKLDELIFKIISRSLKNTKLKVEKQIEEQKIGTRQAITINGVKMPDSIGIALKEASAKDRKKLEAFWKKLSAVGNDKVIKNLFDFLKHPGFKILPSGNFLAYKYVESNFMDSHSKTFDNSPGKTVSMPREKCDPNDLQTCSTGLHVGAWKYVRGSGQRRILVEVDPVNVVSVPNDYNGQKMRTCEYKVIKEVTDILPGTLLSDVALA